MKIRHRIVYDKETVSKTLTDFLKEKNAKFEKSSGYIGVAYLYEEDEWKDDLSSILQKEKIISMIDGIYAKDEFYKAQWFTIRSKYRFEYPQPEDAFSYENHTYENSKYCNSCGCGLKQIKSFKINKAPKWGKRHFLMLNWIEDEIFTSSIAKDIIIKEDIRGLKFLEVINNIKNNAFEDIYQIHVEEVLKPGLINLSQSAKEVLECSKCGGIKYIYSGKGLTYRKEIFDNINCDIVKTFETFGDGHICARKIVVSKKNHQAIIDNKLDKDLVFEPITLI